jgi:peptidoglycan hydrolase-like protein with peptidoglycan-binding domain
VTVTADIPAGTTITGDSSWDGTIEAPTATTTTLSVSGFDVTITSAIAIGSSDSDLTFDKGVKLTFVGQAGQHVGWYNHAGTFAEITDTCSADSQTAGDALAAGGSCKIDVGGDLVVWTKHFSTFVTYTQTAVSTGGSSGGSSGGSNGAPVGTLGTVTAVIPTAPASTPSTGSAGSTGGEVLGAEAYQFGTNLTVGSRGQDVVELQKILMAEGFDIPALRAGVAYGYFGSQTKAAVIKYQAAHHISPQSGFVGPLTRAELNKGSAPASGGTSGTQTLSDAQVQSILGVLQSFGADQATIDSVTKALRGQ